MAPLLFILGMALFASPLLAEEIYMKDGRTIEGKIVKESETHLEVATDYGYITLKQTDIVRVKKDSGLPKLGDLFGSDSGNEEQTATEEDVDPPPEATEDASTEGQSEGEKIGALDGEKSNRITRLDTLYRSMIWPGWGQFKQDRGIWGTAYSLSFAAAIVNYGYSEIESQQKRIHYENEAETFYNQMYANQASLDQTLFLYQWGQVIGARSAYTDSVSAANAAGGILLGIYAANLIDVVWHHPSEQTSGQLGILVLPGKSAELSYTWRF